MNSRVCAGHCFELGRLWNRTVRTILFSFLRSVRWQASFTCVGDRVYKTDDATQLSLSCYSVSYTLLLLVVIRYRVDCP